MIGDDHVYTRFAVRRNLTKLNINYKKGTTRLCTSLVATVILVAALLSLFMTGCYYNGGGTWASAGLAVGGQDCSGVLAAGLARRRQQGRLAYFRW